MNNSLVKYKDLALKVIYYTKKRQLGSKIFFATSKFQEVLAYFERNLKDSQTFLKSCYFLNGKQIYPSDILLYFCTVDPNLRLVEEDMFLEIEELEHLDDASEPICEKLLKPIINPFKLIMLNIKDGILQQVDFPKEKIEELGLDSINNNYACCNSTDSLYISCGKNFWIISYNNFKIEKKEMPFSKEKHSMTYILSNNTIFIAGGSDDSFYYDINTKEFITWGKMNGAQEQPALIQFGDFLYSFNSFNKNGIYFEKTKLTNPAKKWEKIVPQSGDQESGFFYNKLFGASKCSGGNILFAGGINNQLRTFIYNLKINVLFINPSKDESVILNERNFYKIDHNFNIAIPANIEKDHIVAIVNKNSKSLNLVQFEQIGIKTRNNLLRFDNPRSRVPGNIIIQCRYMSIKDYENFLKQKEMQKNNKTKGGFDIYNRKEQGKKLGDKLNGDPYRYQYRGKTPLALERITEGKSDEENEDDEISRNKSSSAKKEKRTLDLGLKLENIGKFNFSTQKREEEKKTDTKNKKEQSSKKGENENQLKENKENINNNNISGNNTSNKKKLKNSNGDSNKKEQNQEENEHNNRHSDLEPIEMSNQRNTYTEVKQQINNSNNKEKSLDEIEANVTPGKNKIKKEELNENVMIEDNVNKKNNQEIEKIKGNHKKKTAREVRHKKLNIDRNEEGKSIEPSDLSSTPHSSLADNNQISKSNNPIINNQTDNANINVNNKNNIYKIQKDVNINNSVNNEMNRIQNYVKNNEKNNININLVNNFDNINIKENEEYENMNSNISNIKNNSKGNIHQKNYMQNKNNISPKKNNISLTKNNMNNNVIINNQANLIINNNLNEHEQKKMKYISKGNNTNNPNIKNIQQKENNIIQKSNTAFITNKNYQNLNDNTANNLSSNPFIDNSKYQNIGEKESYHLKEEIEPNANKILTNKNAKSIKELKTTQKKTNYKTNTVTSMQTNTQGLLSDPNHILISNQNIISNNIITSQNNNNSSNNLKTCSYKASTHKQIKGKKVKNVNHNGSINININNEQVIPKSKKIVNKNNISPEQKNKIIAQKINNNNIQTEGNNKKNQNYVEMYMKYNKVQNLQSQRLNTTGNINTNHNNPLNINNIRIMKSDIYVNNQHNLSNDKIIRGPNNINHNMKNNVVITKDGKRYVFAKNIQRVRKEEEDKMRNISHDAKKING